MADDLYGLSQALADYLDDADRVDLINNSYLMSRSAVLAKRRVTAARIEEARAQIEKYTVDAPEDSHVARTLADTSPWSPMAADVDDVDEMDDLDKPWPDQAPQAAHHSRTPSDGATPAPSSRVVRSSSGTASRSVTNGDMPGRGNEDGEFGTGAVPSGGGRLLLDNRP